MKTLQPFVALIAATTMVAGPAVAEPGNAIASPSGVPMSLAKRLSDRAAAPPQVVSAPPSGLPMRDATLGRTDARVARKETPPQPSSLSGVPMVVAKRL
jgi:hypothetical protein